HQLHHERHCLHAHRCADRHASAVCRNLHHDADLERSRFRRRRQSGVDRSHQARPESALVRMGIPAMIRVRPFVARRHMAGLSLIEMMIALIMALIVAAGIITVFASTSSSNKVQQQMAALQEEGRFAIQSLRSDLGNGNGAYCANSGGNASMVASGISLDSLNAPTVTSNVIGSVNAAFADDTTPLDDPGNAFALPSFVFLRG